MPYTINKSDGPAREAVKQWLYGLDLVSAATRENVITAWVSAWTSSEHKTLRDMPWDPAISDYSLMDHVNEVTRVGLDLAEQAKREWGAVLDPEVLVPILCLHDVDKPLMFVRRDGKVVHSALYSEIPHGVVGGMLLKELGFSHPIISTVSTHSPRMPFPGKNYEAFVLHYADHFCCDNAMLRAKRTPLYFHLSLPEKY
jgi:hypothetical protein